MNEELRLKMCKLLNLKESLTGEEILKKLLGMCKFEDTPRSREIVVETFIDVYDTPKTE